MRYLDYYRFDTLNGEGVRATLFVSGCIHACPKCFNPKSQNFKAGKVFSKEMEDLIIADLNDERVKRKGLTLSGGDPFHPDNAKELIPFIHRVKRETTGKDIWSWTGYEIKDLKGVQLELLSLIDVLVDGKFIDELKDPTLKFRGSSNQIIHRLNEK